MKRLGVRPRPFRSRLLPLVPLGVAFYMFLWPTLRRLVRGDSLPHFSNHLMTEGFWDTFPGPVFAALTFLVCGFAAVYFLGSKGFCTYGCPYGALFVAADRLSPGRILVNDNCEGCGHCTVTCTSNVRVHEEVARYGMVVDPGCMKCTDCVSACPKGALRFGFATPSLFRRRANKQVKPRRYSLGLGTELVLLAACVGTTLAFRGLYDGPPLLLSVGLGGLTAFALLKLWQVATRPAVLVQNLQLKQRGVLSASGRFFLAAGLIWLLFTAHSGFVQWHRARGRHYLDRTEAPWAEVMSGQFRRGQYSANHHDAAARSLRHFTVADRWGLADVTEVKLGLAWGLLLAGDSPAAEGQLRESIEVAPDRAQLHQNLVDFLLARGRLAEATVAIQEKIQATTAESKDHFLLGGLLAEAGRHQDAVAHYRACIELTPGSPEAHYNLGGLLRRTDRPAEAIDELGTAAELAPGDVDTWIELGLAYQATERHSEAVAAFRHALDLAPHSPEARFQLQNALGQAPDP
jgi:tetratricopeptide (TPR) repeat protein/ferredoxin